MKQKKIVFHSYWKTGHGWEPTTATEEDFDQITKIGNVWLWDIFICFSAFGESHILTGNYETT